MKLPVKNKLKKDKIKKNPVTKPKKEKVLLVAQEFKFARLLSGNEKKTRDRVLKTLKRWLLNCFDKKHEFKEDDFIRVWKGLFYAVWMSDKPLVQEDLCESIAATLDLFPPEQIEYAIMMIKAGFKILAMEWYGIDQHRMDKFLMLVRRYLRGSLRCLLRCEWSLRSCQMFADMLCSGDGILAVKTPLYARNATSLMLHFTDCYLEEISKVSNGEIPEESLVALLYPMSVQVCGGDGQLAIACRRVFTALIRQSELGLEYEIATSAWNKLGCPAGGPEALERVSDDDSDDDDDNDADTDQPAESGKQNDRAQALDARAGRVDVALQPLPVPARLLALQLRAHMAGAASRAHKRARICAERFEELSRDQYPLRVAAGEAAGLEARPERAERRRAADRLRALEKQLVNKSDELALRGLSRKHRKRLLAKSRSGINIADELLPKSSTPADSTNGDWRVEITETEDKNKQSDSNNENKATTKKKDRKRKLQEKNNKDNSKKIKTDKPKSLKQLETKKKNNINDKKSINDSGQSGRKAKLNNKIVSNKENNKVASKEKSSMNRTNDSKHNSKKGNIDKNILNKKKNKILNSNKATGNNKLSDDSKTIKDSNNIEKKKTSQEKLINFKANKPTNGTNNLLPKKQKEVNTKEVNAKEVNKKFKPQLVVNKVKKYQKQINVNIKKDGSPKKKVNIETPKKVKFVLKNNSMQETMDYYKSVKQSPNIPFDSSKKPTKTNLKPSTPSPINPFLKKKLKLKKL